MANPVITHLKVSHIVTGDPNQIDGPDWNATHVVTGLENVPNVDTTNADNITSGTLSRPIDPTIALSGTATSVLPASIIEVVDNVQVTATQTWEGHYTPEGWGNVNGLTVNWESGADGTWTGARTPILQNLFFSHPSSPSNVGRFYASGISTANIYVDDNGTVGTPAGIAYGYATVTYLGPNVKHWYGAIGVEADMILAPGSHVELKFGFISFSSGADTVDSVQGTAWDAAYLAGATGGAVGWRNAYLVGSVDGTQPLSADGKILATQGAVSCTSGIDFTGATFSGYYFKTSTYTVTGAGVVSSVGVSDGSAATTGYVGEYISASGFSPAAAAAATITIASPAVVSCANVSGFVAGPWTSPVKFSTTGALPTGITAGTQYWIIGSSLSGNSFRIATSPANALAGTAINTTGSQSGTHTGTPGRSLTSGTAATVAAISISAGDWDVDGVVGYASDAGGTTTVTVSCANLGTALDTLDTTPGKFVETITPAATPAAGAGNVLSVPPYRFSVTIPTIVYLQALSIFAVSTNAAYGKLGARRAR